MIPQMRRILKKQYVPYRELEKYNPELLDKRRILAISKQELICWMKNLMREMEAKKS